MLLLCRGRLGYEPRFITHLHEELYVRDMLVGDNTCFLTNITASSCVVFLQNVKYVMFRNIYKLFTVLFENILKKSAPVSLTALENKQVYNFRSQKYVLLTFKKSCRQTWNMESLTGHICSSLCNILP